MCYSKFPKSNGVWELQDCTSSFLVWAACWVAEETIPTSLGWEDLEHSRASRSGLLVTKSVPVVKQGPDTWSVLEETYLRGRADHSYMGSSRLLLCCRLFSLDMTVWLVWMHTWEFSSWMQSGLYFSGYTRNRSKLGARNSHIGNRSMSSEARCLALNPVFVSLSFLG